MSQPRVLVTGGTGFLGPFVVAELRRVASVVTLARSGADLDCDVADAPALAAALAGAAPDYVLHLAALSRMAMCKGDPERARAVNAAPAQAIARRYGARSLYVSTDLVFDGRRAPYSALDPVAPLSEYGQSKAEGEELALAAGGRVARIPLLFGPDDRGRGATAMVRGAIDAGRPVSLFTNEYRTPLHAADAARGLVELLFAPATPPLVHLGGPERVSRWELGQRYCAVHGLPTGLLCAIECQDGTRPRDVSLRSDWCAPRDLDEQLRSA